MNCTWRKNIIPSLVLLLSSCSLSICIGQQNPYVRNIKIEIRDSIKLVDTLYIIPESVTLLPDQLSAFRYVVEGKEITVYNLTETPKEINLIYSVLAGSPEINITGVDTGMLSDILENVPMSYRYPPSEYKKNKESNNEIQYIGAFGRGLSFGNNQNVVLNSTLNLQLAGKLGDDIEINAAITDENLPIQADGNTQQLNEIDKVFIEIKRKNQTLLAGDQQLKPDDTYFLKYYKKYKGLQFLTKNDLSDGGTIETQFGGAIARGNFKRQTLDVQEANQGPYRLTGNGSEIFIIVLSGSEKVYLDGLLLTRGLEYDYVMDYNRSEISFTSKRLLNRNSRVIVEFEFSNQSYLKSAWSLQSRYHKKDITLQWNSYTEGDNKTSNILQTLSTEDKQLLNQAGDQLNNLNRSTIRKVEPGVGPNTIRYNLVDTIVSGVQYLEVLILAPNTSTNNYTAQFNYVGQGQGNYITEHELFTNGRAYRWVSPDPGTGIKNGAYEPTISLTAPKKQMQHSMWLEYKPLNGLYSRSEISLSNLDNNLYSSKDKSDDYGLGWKQQLVIEKQLNPAGLTWKNEFSIEKISQNFSIIEPFRNPEFNRDWSLPSNSSSSGKSLLWALQSGLHQDHFVANYKLQRYTQSSFYQGMIHGWNLAFDHAGTTVKASGSAMFNSSMISTGSLIRPKMELRQSIIKKGHHTAGISLDQETNKQSFEPNTPLLPNSFSFKTLRAFAEGNLANNKSSYRAEYAIRQDEKINGDHFEKHYHSNEYALEHQWRINEYTQWNFRAAGRKLSYDQVINPIQEKNSTNLLVRQAFATRTKNNAFRFNQTIETGRGQEPSIEYTYIKVNKGQGYYTWIDINKDSTIQVTEFELAPFSDQGEYIRYAISGNDFVSTKNYLYLQNFEFDGIRLLQPQLQKKWFHKLTFASSWNFNWKLADETAFVLPIDPNPDQLISLQGIMRNQLYLNKGAQKLELQAGQLLSTNKWRLTTGYEIRSNKEYFLRSRQRINQSLSFESYLASTAQSNHAAFFKEKNFTLQSWIIEPKLHFQYKNTLRLSGSYRYKTGNEQIAKTHTMAHETKLEITSQPWPTWSLRSSISSIWASLSGPSNPWTEYSILQGLRPGKNLLLQLNIDKEINANTTLRLGYDGRQSEGGRYIQTGRAQVLASF